MSIDYLGTFWVISLYIIPMLLCWRTSKGLYESSKDENDMGLLLAAIFILISFIPIVNVVLGYLMLILYILSKLKEKNK